MIKVRKLKHCPYGSDIVFLMGTTAELNSYIKRHLPGCEPLGGHQRAHCIVEPPRNAHDFYHHYIALQLNQVRASSDRHFELAATLGHEALHCANDILERHGVKTPADNDEPLTYYFEFIFRQVLSFAW